MGVVQRSRYPLPKRKRNQPPASYWGPAVISRVSSAGSGDVSNASRRAGTNGRIWDPPENLGWD